MDRAEPVDLVVAGWAGQAASERALHVFRLSGTTPILGALALDITADGELLVTGSEGRSGHVGAVLDAGLGMLTSGIGWLLLDGACTIGAEQARDGGVREEALRVFGEHLGRRSSVLLTLVAREDASTVRADLEAGRAVTVRTGVAPSLLAGWAARRPPVPGPRPPADSPIAIRTSATVMRSRDGVRAQ